MEVQAVLEALLSVSFLPISITVTICIVVVLEINVELDCLNEPTSRPIPEAFGK